MSYDHKSSASLNLVSSMYILTGDDIPTPLTFAVSIYTINLFLFDIYYIPILSLSLAFVSQLCDSDYSLVFFPPYFVMYIIHNPGGQLR